MVYFAVTKLTDWLWSTKQHIFLINFNTFERIFLKERWFISSYWFVKTTTIICFPWKMIWSFNIFFQKRFCYHQNHFDCTLEVNNSLCTSNIHIMHMLCMETMSLCSMCCHYCFHAKSYNVNTIVRHFTRI